MGLGRGLERSPDDVWRHEASPAPSSAPSGHLAPRPGPTQRVERSGVCEPMARKQHAFTPGGEGQSGESVRLLAASEQHADADRDEDGWPPRGQHRADVAVDPAQVLGQEEQADDDQDQGGDQVGAHRLAGPCLEVAVIVAAGARFRHVRPARWRPAAAPGRCPTPGLRHGV